MDIETTIAEFQQTEDTSPKSTPEKSSYKVFHYFKEHSGLLVTCISALVAVMSFVLHFAVGRMNYAYLEYWSIASLYANTNNQNEFYLVVFSMLYLLSLMIIHGLLSKTSEVFRYYNKLLSTTNQTIRVSHRLMRQLRKKLCVLSKKTNKLTPQEKSSSRFHAINEKIEEYQQILEDGLNATQKLKAARRNLRKNVYWRIACTILLSYIVGGLLLALGSTTVTFTQIFQLSLPVIASISIGFLIYFLPAYFSTRCSRKQYENENIIETINALLRSEVPEFPLRKIIRNGIKPIFSDRMLKLAAVQMVVVTVLMLFTTSLAGTTGAKQQRRFPMYSDGSTSYAIVYINDSTVFMEEAIAENGTLIIDTTKQRIVTSNDLSYDMVVFDDVVVIKNEDYFSIS